ncbi:hypothetical protein [Halanaerobium sp. ST460_2HS_T2]|uniref:hypothetical protein n=1 Tax=Halanaerobium sp. ST460_2HS_T2 TaxID=2183914 RepID=UPI000DF21610|nr:hypothetical protein [Halanaerobium sp. ST460_2HS_T2]RCW52335.1 hypothetical protein DFR80_13027 [Halanaerobium sp. ST460_2HS_T2]
MEYYKKYFLSPFWFLFIILIIFISAITVVASSNSEEIMNINSSNFNNQISINHILFKLEIIDVTDKNISSFNLERFEYEEENDQEFNFINKDQLIEFYGNNFEIMLQKLREQESEESILSPRIIVAPGHTATLQVAEEELYLDVESVDSITYTNIFELDLTPKNEFDKEENPILTVINLKTGKGPTGIATEVWIKPAQPYLLALMESTRKNRIEKKIGERKEIEKRYFAVFLTARPVGVLTLPDLSVSLAGLEEIFNHRELSQKETRLILKYAYEKKIDQNQKISLSGFYQNDSNIKIDLKLNEILTDRHTISLSGHIYDNLWMGLEFIKLANKENELALKFSDLVKLGPLKLDAGLNPLTYNFEDRESNYKNPNWYIRGESDLGQKLNFALEYRSLIEYDFAGIDVAYDFNNYGLLFGYTWNVDLDQEESYWLGLQYEF